MPDLRVWIATSEEFAEAARLLAEFGHWVGGKRPDEAEIRSGVERIHAAGDGEFLLGSIDGGTPAGICQVRFRWSVWTSSEDAWIEDVFVREQARRSGLGRALVEAAVERARERSCLRIELDVDAANEPALTLYRSLGFSGELKAEDHSLLLGRRVR